MSSRTLPLPPSLSLVGKAAIVTGSSRGIGRAIALLLAKHGAKVAITYTSSSSTEQAQSLAAEIDALPHSGACIVQADLEALDCGPKVIEGALRGLDVKNIDILVNNAAKSSAPHPATDFDLEGFDMSMNLLVRAPMLLVKELLPVMAEKDGRIINISSVITRFPVPTRTTYAIAKGALETLTQQWAAELPKKFNCTVNAVRVGATITEATRAAASDPNKSAETLARERARTKIIEQTSAAARLGEVDDIAQVVAWLATEGSRWVNGQTINANGGVVFN